MLPDELGAIQTLIENLAPWLGGYHTNVGGYTITVPKASNIYAQTLLITHRSKTTYSGTGYSRHKILRVGDQLEQIQDGCTAGGQPGLMRNPSWNGPGRYVGRAVAPLLIAGMLALAACSASPSASHASAASADPALSATPAAAGTAKASPLSCTQQARAWQGAGLLDAVVADVATTGAAALTDTELGHVTSAARNDAAQLDTAVGRAATVPMPACADSGGWYARTLRDARTIAAHVSSGRSPTVIAADLKQAHAALENADEELKTRMR